MSAELKIAVAEFNKAVASCIEFSERTYPEFVNGQALRLASFAARETPRADANKIAWQLGQTDRRFTNKRTGKALKTPRRVFGNSTASINLYRIINWRRKRAGKPSLGGQEMSSVARKARGAMLRSTGYIASGWIWSIRGLAKAVGYTSAPKVAKISGKPKGYAITARPAINSQVACEIGNTALLAVSADRTGKRPGNPMPQAQAGLTRAYMLTTKDMLEHLAKKLAPVFKKHSAA